MPLPQKEREKQREEQEKRKEKDGMEIRERAKVKGYEVFNKVVNKVADKGGLHKSVRKSSSSFGLSNDPPAPFGNLTVSIKQAHVCGRKCNKRTGAHFFAPASSCVREREPASETPGEPTGEPASPA
jgi:hypothetical protein